MNFEEKLNQFVERGAIEHQEKPYDIYGRESAEASYKACAASLKPIVLKLVNALNELNIPYQVNSPKEMPRFPNEIIEEALAEVEKMVEVGK